MLVYVTSPAMEDKDIQTNAVNSKRAGHTCIWVTSLYIRHEITIIARAVLFMLEMNYANVCF